MRETDIVELGRLGKISTRTFAVMKDRVYSKNWTWEKENGR